MCVLLILLLCNIHLSHFMLIYELDPYSLKVHMMLRNFWQMLLMTSAFMLSYPICITVHFYRAAWNADAV